MTKHPMWSTSELWARFRFSVVGSLLSSPPARGELQAALPLDRTANAEGRRAVITPLSEEQAAPDTSRPRDELPPLLKQILAEYSATGLPPAYLRKNSSHKNHKKGGAQ